jgi:hypothetical protein
MRTEQREGGRTMDEYISRKDAIAKIREEGVYGSGYSNEEREDNVVDMIESVPAADVRPVVKAVWKHVQWVVDEEWQEGGYWISRCSNCSMPYHTETPFCPHCGADMREKPAK